MNTADITAEVFVESMLRHVPFDGWSEAAMQVTAEELGMSASDVDVLFPIGVIGVIETGLKDIDNRMVDIFMARFDAELATMPVHVRVRELLLARFELLQPHKEAVRKLLAFMALPRHAKLGTSLVYKTLDRVWRAAGDRSTDYNFYTKRATLGAVYGATLLAFLDDDTPDMQKTRAFLDRRLKDVANVPKVTKPIRTAASVLGKMMKNAASMQSRGRGV